MITYPNPVVNGLQVVINSGFIGDIILQLFNTKGDMVYASTISKTDKIVQHEMDMKDTPKGLYLLRITQGGSQIVKKILK